MGPWSSPSSVSIWQESPSSTVPGWQLLLLQEEQALDCRTLPTIPPGLVSTWPCANCSTRRRPCLLPFCLSFKCIDGLLSEKERRLSRHMSVEMQAAPLKQILDNLEGNVSVMGLVLNIIA